MRWVVDQGAPFDNFWWENGKENGSYYRIYRGYLGIMEKKMETTIGYVGFI